MKNTISCMLVLLCSMASLVASATNYYVDPSSTGSNQGTFNDPWKSIDDIPWAINYYSPGDTIFFKRGQEYVGTMSMNSSGSSSAPIVLMPYGSGAAPLFKYSAGHFTDPLVYNRVMIRLNQCNHIVIDGFEMTDFTIPNDHSVAANVGYGVYIYAGPGNNGSNNIVRNCKITKLGSGVCIDGGSFNTVTNCTIGDLRMILNTPDVEWDDFGAMGIMVGGSDNTITHNQIHECYGTSYDYHIDGGAIEMYGSVSNNKILYNTASENIGFMEFGSGSGGQALNNLVGYNLLVNNGHVFWINSASIYSLDVRNLQFVNNNIIETHAPRIADVRNMIGIMSTPTVANVLTMKNNIFWIATAQNITDPNAQPFNGPQLIHQNNMFHLSGGSLGYNMDVTETNLPAGFSPFIDITSSSNPLLWNYDLKPACTAIDFGQFTGIDKDFQGKPVPYGGLPDAGIIESIAIVLPLEILSSRGYSTTVGNIIEWETNKELAKHFEVEKSSDGQTFGSIATIPYKTDANTSSIIYRFTDGDIKGEVQYYRIKGVEANSKEIYSKIISIKSVTVQSSPGSFTLFPNPAQDHVYLKYPGNDFLNKEVMVVSMAGVVVKRQRLNDASAQVKLNIGDLPKGAYALKLFDTKTGQTHSTMLTK
ncbi:T9SS type A sorting domain-containing protein [Niastella populi]|nr:T9SS type A sorting domain-containing protein [Niastella populi]